MPAAVGHVQPWLGPVDAAQAAHDHAARVAQPVIDPQTSQPFPGNVIPSSRLDSTSLRIQELYIPPPNVGGPDTLVNNLAFEHPYPDDLFRAAYPMVRIDHNLSSKNSIYGRYIRRYTPYVLKRGLPGFDGAADDK